MRKLTILFALLTLSAGMWAQEVGDKFFDVVSELNFEITAVGETNTVAVSPTSSYFQPTTCTVPVSVTYKSVTFTVTSIGENAFITWSTLQTITLPFSVTTIGEYAFQSCEALQSIDLSHVTTIGDRAFTGCKLLQSVDLSHVTTIGNRVFIGCTLLQSISLPSSVTSIGDQAFTGCGSLTEVTVAWTEADKILAIEANVFYQIANKQGPSGATLRVPEGTKALYQAKDVWNTFGKIIDLAEIKAAAIAEIEQMATDAKADIDNASTYEEAKATQTKYKNEIDATVSGATYAINNATSIGAIDEELLQTTTDINYVKTEALAEIAKINVLAKAKADAVELIQTARQGIQNTEINTLIDNGVDAIRDATTEQQVEEVKLQIMTIITSFQIGRKEGDAAGHERGYTAGETAGYAQGKEEGFAEGKTAGITEGKAAGRAEALGAMDTPCTDCPAVEVSDGTTTVTLYNPKNVNFIKK